MIKYPDNSYHILTAPALGHKTVAVVRIYKAILVSSLPQPTQTTTTLTARSFVMTCHASLIGFQPSVDSRHLSHGSHFQFVHPIFYSYEAKRSNKFLNCCIPIFCNFKFFCIANLPIAYPILQAVT